MQAQVRNNLFLIFIVYHVTKGTSTKEVAHNVIQQLALSSGNNENKSPYEADNVVGVEKVAAVARNTVNGETVQKVAAMTSNTIDLD